jgi:hypothetical protein
VKQKAVLASAAFVALAAACSASGSSGSSSTRTTRRTVAPISVPAPRFVDVTKHAGLDVVQSARRLRPHCLLGGPTFHARFPTVPEPAPGHESNDQCIPERMSGGVAIGDYDGDGWPDVYLTRLDGPGALYRNDHDGTFTDATTAAGLDAVDEPTNGAAFADVDNDGRLDLLVTTLAGTRFYLFHGDGHGHFVDEAAARGVALASDRPHVGFSVNVGDFDNDGWLDLETTEWRSPELAGNLVPSNNRLFRNRGANAPGYFTDVTESTGVAVEQQASPALGFASAFRDLDGDGKPDIFFAGDYKTSRLFWGSASGTFTDGTKIAGVNTAENAMGLTIGDYDGDGRPDVFVTSIFDSTNACRDYACGHGNTGNRLYRNDGHRHFTDVTSAAGVRDGGWGWGTAFFDAENRGYLDLVMTSGVDFPWDISDTKYRTGPMHLWMNRGNGTFADDTLASGLTVPGPGKGLAVFDFDRDGRLDVLVVRDGTTPVLYRNETPGANAWLDVRTVGTRSNREGLGAVVTAQTVAGGPRQTVVVDSTTHFLGWSDPTVHLGFGAHRGPIADLRVSWPASGRTSVLRNVRPDQTVTVAEPSA